MHKVRIKHWVNTVDSREVDIFFMKKNLINKVLSFNCCVLILNFNYSSFILWYRLYYYLFRAIKRIPKKIKHFLNFSEYYAVVENTSLSSAQYLKSRRLYTFYVTLVILFVVTGVLDIFFFSNSAFSLMVYLLSIALVLLLSMYSSKLVLNAVSAAELYLISFSSLKSKSLSIAYGLSKVTSGVKTGLSSIFFNMLRVVFVRSVARNFVSC